MTVMLNVSDHKGATRVDMLKQLNFSPPESASLQYSEEPRRYSPC
jgi:hypothetical protein